ncbi:MAG: efflux RND transporter permease subunit [Myxococcota bacterium]
MTSLFLRNRRLLGLVIAVVFVAGSSSLVTMRKQEDPTITDRIAVIVTPYPGVSAENVEALVTEPLENELREIPEVETLTSFSRAGVSVVTAEVNENLRGSDASDVFSEIRDALADAQSRFPEGTGTPFFDDRRYGAYMSITGLTWTRSSPPPLAILSRVADDLQDRLRDVDGTKQASVFGAPPEEIRVSFDEGRIASVGLTPEAVARAIGSADSKVAAGTLDGPTRSILLEVTGELDSLERIRRVPLRISEGASQLRVGDVATVERAIADPVTERGFVNGQPAVFVAARKEAAVSYDVWFDGVDDTLDAFEDTLPGGVALVRTFEQQKYTTVRLLDLLRNLLIGMGLVVIVLFISLGWRSALVVTAALPLVALASLATMNAIGVPIHQMSVTGLIVALGLLVDSAIVVTDAVRARRLRGEGVAEAVQGSVRRLWVPILSSTLTTILAFMPIVLMPGLEGEFTGAIALSVIAALVWSYVLSMTVVATIAGRFVPTSGQPDSLLATGFRSPRLANAFGRSLEWSLRNPWKSMGLAALLPLIGFASATTLAEQFFPAADRNQFHVEVRLPEGASIEETTSAAHEVERALRTSPEVTDVMWTVGRSAPPFYYNLKQEQEDAAHYAQAQVDLRSVEAVAEVMPILQERVDRAVPEAQVLIRELLQGPPVDAPLELRLYGDDLDTLRELGEQVRVRMEEVPSVTHSLATLTAGTPKAWLEVDESQANLAGLPLRSVAAQLNARTNGVRAGSVIEGIEEVPVRVRAAAGRTDLDEALSTTLISPLGGSDAAPGVPLSALAHTTVSAEIDAIPRRNGRRVNIVRGFTHAGVFPETAQGALAEVLEADPVVMPPGYRLEVGGDAEKRSKAIGKLMSSMPLLLLLMIAVVALSLSSFRLTAVVFAVALQSIGLGLLSLAALGYPLGFMTILGLMGLVGVAINAAIIIASALRANPDAVAGDPEAIRATVLTDTSRHIISTTITTFGGFLPLIVGAGGFWPPFASGIAGGVLLSGVLSFYFVPAAFLVITRRRPVVDTAPTRGARFVPTGIVGFLAIVLTATPGLAQDGAEVPLADIDRALAEGQPRLSLSQVARRGADESPRVDEANASADEALAARDGELVELFPRLLVSAQYTRVSEIDNPPLVPGMASSNIRIPQNQYGVGVVVSYSLTRTLLESLRAVESADYAIDAARLLVDAAKNAGALEATVMFLDYVAARGRGLVAAQRLREAQDDLVRADARLAAGVTAAPDPLRFRAEVAAAEQRLAESEAVERARRAALVALLNLEPRPGSIGIGEPMTTALTPRATSSDEELFEAAWANRPEVAALRRSLDARRAIVQTAQVQLAPSLELFGQLDYARPNSLYVPPNDSPETSWIAGARVRWSPDGFARGIQRQRRASAEVARVTAALHRLEDAIRAEVALASYTYRATFPRLRAARQQIDAAERAYAATRAGYAQGLTEVVDVIDAAQALNRARLALLQAGVDMRKSDARLCFALGERLDHR